MANLPWSQLSKYNDRIDLFVKKINEREEFDLVKGGRLVLDINPIGGYEKWFKDLSVSPKAPPGGHPLVDADNPVDKYALGALLKTKEFGGAKFNLGNTGEGVFAAALVARFLSKTKRINERDVANIIDRLFSRGNQPKQIGNKTSKFIEKNFKSPNKNPLIIDNLYVKIELANKDMLNFRDRYEKYKTVIGAAVAYANQTNVRRWADMLYNNNVVNTINVLSLGVSGQTETKVDTFVEIGTPEIKPRKVNINVSLKVGDIKQFGSAGGVTYQAQQAVWEQSFAFKNLWNVSEEEFTNHIKNEEYAEAFQLSLKAAKFAADRHNDLGRSIGEGIVYWATLGQKKVEMVALKSQRAVVYDFRNAVEIISKEQIKSELVTGGNRLPTLKFFVYDKEGNLQPLVQIRIMWNKSNNYFRTVIEKGKYLEKLIGRSVAMPRAS